MYSDQDDVKNYIKNSDKNIEMLIQENISIDIIV